MLKSKTTVETNKTELLITIGAEEFEGAVARAFSKNVDKINVPGFRKGKAPRALIEKRYGTGVFYEDAFGELYPAAVDSAVKEADILPVSRPDIEIVSIGADGVEFKATVWVKPEVEIEGYKGLEVERPDASVSDEEVNAEIDRARERNSRVVTIEGSAENGIIANIDFEGFVDGVAFEGGSAKGYDLTLGSGSFIPGFEDQILGHIAGDEFDVKVSFPEDYGAEQLAGKASVFKVKLNSLKRKELPELDDEFVKDVSEKNTVEEYKQEIRERLQKAADSKADDAVDVAVSDKLVELLKGEIPEVMFENATDDAVREFEYRIRMQGATLEQYMQYTGTTYDEFRKNFRDQAIARVKSRLALEKIASLENLEVTSEEIDSEYAKLAERYKEDLAKIKTYISESELVSDLKVNKAVDLVKAAAVVKKAKKAAEKASKKTAAAEEPATAEKPKKAAAKKAVSDDKATGATAEKPKKAPAKKAVSDDKATEAPAEKPKKAPAKKPAAKKE